MGIVILPSSVFFWYMRWLPVCLTRTKPSFSMALQSSFPLICGKLAIDFKFLNLTVFCKMRDIFNSYHLNITRGSILEHINRFLYCFSFCGYVKFRAINYIAAFFSRSEFCGNFYLLHNASYVDRI